MFCDVSRGAVFCNNSPNISIAETIYKRHDSIFFICRTVGILTNPLYYDEPHSHSHQPRQCTNRNLIKLQQCYLTSLANNLKIVSKKTFPPNDL